MIHYRMSNRMAAFCAGLMAGILLTGFVYEAKAAPMDGHSLYSACVKDEFVAAVYVTGVSETLQYVGQSRFCLPPNVGPEQSKNTVCRGLYDNQTLLAGDAVILTHAILAKEFPCR